MGAVDDQPGILTDHLDPGRPLQARRNPRTTSSRVTARLGSSSASRSSPARATAAFAPGERPSNGKLSLPQSVRQVRRHELPWWGGVRGLGWDGIEPEIRVELAERRKSLSGHAANGLPAPRGRVPRSEPGRPRLSIPAFSVAIDARVLPS